MLLKQKCSQHQNHKTHTVLLNQFQVPLYDEYLALKIENDFMNQFNLVKLLNQYINFTKQLLNKKNQKCLYNLESFFYLKK